MVQRLHSAVNNRKHSLFHLSASYRFSIQSCGNRTGQMQPLNTAAGEIAAAGLREASGHRTTRHCRQTVTAQVRPNTDMVRAGEKSVREGHHQPRGQKPVVQRDVWELAREIHTVA